MKLNDSPIQESIRRILREETSDLKDIIFDMINDATKGVDVYKYKGELWLIFTDEKRWVINLQKSEYLYYNYYFFQDIFKYFSMDVIENQHYITEWVEDTIRNGVKYTNAGLPNEFGEVEDTIRNGVKLNKS